MTTQRNPERPPKPSVWIRLGLIALMAICFATPSFAQAFEFTTPDEGSDLEIDTEVTFGWNDVSGDIPKGEEIMLSSSTDDGETWEHVMNISPGETEVTITIPIIFPPDSKVIYRLSVTDNAGDGEEIKPGERSFTTRLICKDPAYLGGVEEYIICRGEAITPRLDIRARKPTFIWYHNGTEIARGEDPSFEIVMNGAENEGRYAVRIVEWCGNTTDMLAFAQVRERKPVAITQQPVAPSAPLCTNTDHTISVIAAGDDLSYQWYHNNLPIVGATQPTYVITNVRPVNAGDYRVVIAGACRSEEVSETITIDITEQPIIVAAPTSSTVCAGTSATFEVSAVGGRLAYQWRFNGVDIEGANGAQFTIAEVTDADTGTYDVVVTNTAAPEGSNCIVVVQAPSAKLNIASAPVIVAQPRNREVCKGSSLDVSILAAGVGLQYQWYRNDYRLDGQTSNVLSIQNVKLSDAGTYTVEVTNACGQTTTSTGFVVSVISKPVIIVQPQPARVDEGGLIRLTVDASDARAYQWKFNGVSIAGATSAVLEKQNATEADAGFYHCIVTNACGQALTTTVRIIVGETSAQGPELALAASRLDYQRVPVGYAHRKATGWFFKNTGTQTLVVNSIDTAEAFAAGFHFPGLVFPFELEPGESAGLTIEFNAETRDRKEATVTISSNSVLGNMTVNLGAQGHRFYQAQETADFSEIRTGTTAVVCIPVVADQGRDVTITGMQSTSSGSSAFAIVSDLPLTIEAGEQGEVCVEFRPLTTGDYDVNVTILSENAGNLDARLVGRATTTTSVDEEQSTNYVITPNPATSDFVIAGLNSTSTVRIISLQGNVLSTTTGTMTIPAIDHAGRQLAAGSYLVVIENGSQRVTLPLVILP